MFERGAREVSGAQKNSSVPVWCRLMAISAAAVHLPNGRRMSADRHNFPRLTVVSSSAPPGTFAGRSDWSALMARAQDGDRIAYRLLLEHIEPYVRLLAGKCFKRQSDIEDTVQDVLLTVHDIRHTYDPGRPFGPWLVAIANRRIVDRLRKDMRRRAREIELSPEHETFVDPGANLETKPDAEPALLGAIERLPPDQRDAVRMLKLKEMTLKQASAHSGRSVTALKVATYRAVRNLRRLLKGDQP